VFRKNRMHHARYGTHYMNSYYNLWEDNESFYNRGGLALMEVRDQEVRNNRAWGNSDHGIMLRTIQDSVVTNNIVAGNQRGFSFTMRNTTPCAAIWWWITRRRAFVGGLDAQPGGGKTTSSAPRADTLRGAKDEMWGVKNGNFWSKLSWLGSRWRRHWRRALRSQRQWWIVCPGATR